MLNTTLSRFRLVGLIEGISFIVLLFIAMPIKYMFGIPIAVKIVGMAHGLLFMLFLYALYEAAKEHNWKFNFVTLSFILSLIPFGTFYLDKKLKVMSNHTSK